MMMEQNQEGHQIPVPDLLVQRVPQKEEIVVEAVHNQAINQEEAKLQVEIAEEILPDQGARRITHVADPVKVIAVEETEGEI
jgi:hypothetical protein